MPFTDPMADGTTIQRANEVALANGIVGPGICITVVAEARKKGLTVPVVLMGYCNPFIMSVELLCPRLHRISNRPPKSVVAVWLCHLRSAVCAHEFNCERIRAYT